MDGLLFVAHREIDDLRVGQRGAARLEHLADLPVLEPARVHPRGPQTAAAMALPRSAVVALPFMSGVSGAPLSDSTVSIALTIAAPPSASPKWSSINAAAPIWPTRR